MVEEGLEDVGRWDVPCYQHARGDFDSVWILDIAAHRILGGGGGDG